MQSANKAKDEKINLSEKLYTFKKTGDDLVNSINSIIVSWDDIISKKKKIITQLDDDIKNTKLEITKLRDQFSQDCEIIKKELEKEKNDWHLLVKECKKFKIDKIINLNVGGTKFVTSKSMFDNCYLKQNFLTVMFSGSWEPNVDIDGNYFIDRDGTYFQYILNFIRDKKYEIVIKNLSCDIKKNILVEANYYRISELVDLINVNMYSNKELINKKIKVYWEKDNKWYIGTIYNYNKFTEKHTIRYDDGDEKSYNLSDKKWELIY